MKGRKIIFAALCILFSLPLGAQVRRSAPQGVRTFRLDTLSVRVEYPKGGSTVDLDYEGNRGRWESFERSCRDLLSDEGSVFSSMDVRVGASFEGTTETNEGLTRERANGIRRFLVARLGVREERVHVSVVGEDWEGLEKAVEAFDVEVFPWRDEVLSIVRRHHLWVTATGGDGRKGAIRALDGGRAWDYLAREVFPLLRSSYVDVVFVVSIPLEPLLSQLGPKDTVVRTEVVRDTVLVGDLGFDRKFRDRVAGKKFIFALRTNFLAVPLANIGVEFPFGEHFSVGLDYYYPWIPRNAMHKDCTEMLAYGFDVRYWLGRDRDPDEARLLGHSFGVYAAGGHYDFERDWNGHQGTFWNVGVDWMYAVPLFHGKVHMEFEIGLGMIYSQAQPYHCLYEYTECIREPGVTRVVRWIGPTRAQVSLVVPIYVKGRNN